MRTRSILSILFVTAAGCSSPGADAPPAKEPPAAPPKQGAASAPAPRIGLVKIGDAAPEADRTMKALDGSMVSIAGVAGAKGTLVIFTCNHCPWVKAWQERTVGTANAFLEQGIGVIAINSNDPADYPEDGIEGMKERSTAQGMKYPYVVDEGSIVARAFGATKTPEFYLFDADGKLAYKGALDDNAQKPEDVTKTYLKDALTALVSGQPISIRTTKAFGCGIKYRDAT
jgi:peroxiredoxin